MQPPGTELLWLGVFCAALAALLLVPVLRPLAVRLALVDRPGGRKQHQSSTPLVGGFAIFLAYLIALWVTGQIEQWRGPIIWIWLLLLSVGLWDDRGDLRVWLRVLLQVGAIVLLCHYSGLRLENLGRLTGDEPVLLGAWALPVTLLGLIGIKNGINLIDGLDGLAGTQVLAVLVWFMLLALDRGESGLVWLCAPLAGAVLGFLVFNLRWRGRPARVFLGDHGSVFLGFTLGWIAVVGSQSLPAAFTPIEAVWVLGLPILDTIRVMLARLSRGRSPFAPGRDHLHHLLLDAGLSVNAVVAIMWLAALLLGSVAWLGRVMALSELVLLCAFLALSAIYFLAAQHLQASLPGQRQDAY